MPVQKNDSIYSASQLEIFSFIDALTPANRPPHNLSRPVFARHVGDRMYRGEYYAMQLDAHVTFIKDWDELMISQYHETKNEYAVLSLSLIHI